MQARLPRHEIVLLGVGHTNAHVLKMWRMAPIPRTRLTCISDHSTATYSGMLPAVLAGQEPREAMEIDLVRLCSANGARLIRDRVSAINFDRQMIEFRDRPAVRFDAVSIGIGSVPATPESLQDAGNLLPIKPMQTFLDRLEHHCSRWDDKTSSELEVVIAGGGVGGLEIAFTLPEFLRKRHPRHRFRVSVVSGSDRIATGLQDSTVRRLEEVLADCGIQIIRGTRIVNRRLDSVILDNGREIPADLVLWATSAVASPLLRSLGLPSDSRGFPLVDSTLRCLTEAPVFAVGDSGTLKDHPIPKAGVYAVRQGPVLWENLQAIVQKRSLRTFQPQRDFLKLINTGDGRGIAEWKGISLYGTWVKRWKDRIDRRFMRMFQEYQPMHTTGLIRDIPESEVQPPRCHGCGSKVGAGILHGALSRLEIPTSPVVSRGLDEPDDAAFLKIPGQMTAITTDAFPAPLVDDYLSGRIAALNALSDLFAVGARPFAALANVTVPLGPDRVREQTLHDVLAGVLRELKQTDATLVGGHTIEGPRLEVGLTILGESAGPRHQNPRPGDQLLLTKPLGTGILLAAHMQSACPASAFEALLQSMLQSNAVAARIIEDFQPNALTDVTGFGVAVHLGELLGVHHAARLQLRRIPVLPEVDRLLGEGFSSTLSPANREIEAEILIEDSARQMDRLGVLFDPQTSGGLLAAVPPEHVDGCIERLQQEMVPATVIGQIEATLSQPTEHTRRILVE